MSIFDKSELLKHLRAQFQIDWKGHHGVAHWSRVRTNGLMLAPHTGANPLVVELFAFFHDSRRINEGIDNGHGARGAELAKKLRGRYFSASDDEMDLLVQACTGHSDGHQHGPATVQTCWDADRLDLGRVGMTLDPARLCTEAAKQPHHIKLAHDRALAWTHSYENRFAEQDDTDTHDFIQ